MTCKATRDASSTPENQIFDVDCGAAKLVVTFRRLDDNEKGHAGPLNDWMADIDPPHQGRYGVTRRNAFHITRTACGAAPAGASWQDVEAALDAAGAFRD